MFLESQTVIVRGNITSGMVSDLNFVRFDSFHVVKIVKCISCAKGTFDSTSGLYIVATLDGGGRENPPLKL